MFNNRWASGAAALAIAASLTPAYAQEITASIRGDVVSSTGAPVSGATVTIVNTETGFARSTTTNATGGFSFRGLSVTGAYDVTVSAPGFDGERIEGVVLSLGQASDLSFTLSSGSSDEIVVRAVRPAGVETAVGPAATFNLDDLRSVPTINRNITDVVRLDPRIFVDESSGRDPIQCGGKNPRFNSLTLDGVRLNDGFGLNSNGFPTERQPFPFDAIEQVAVELAPFDVEYGGFTACNINAVTKSGTNTFSGTAFIDYTDDSLQGDSLEGQDILAPAFDEVRYGIQVGGPIIQDTLFFSVAYEKLEGANLFTRGVQGSGAINEVDLTQAELDEILDISRNVYGYEPGDVPSSFDNEDEKLLVKLDWNINDNHRAAFTYNYNDGFNISQSDGDQDEFELSNHLYERGAELKNYSGTLFSDWTDAFSTEIRLGYVDLDNRQNSIGGTDFGEITIETDDVDVYLGGDDSRQSNKLAYEIFQFAAKAYYNIENHNLTFGFEREAFEIFNVFVQHTETEIDFERILAVDTNTWVDADGDGRADAGETGVTEFSAIDAFRLGIAENVDYNNAPSGDPFDAAADWGYAVNTLYFQDEMEVTPALTVIAGLRYDFWQTDDEPETNEDFLADYGFSNGQTLDGLGLLQPRLAFTWEAKENLSIRGGLGRYSGGDPNVWLSNTYSANNVLQFGARDRSIEVSEDFFAYDGTVYASADEALAAEATSLFDLSYGACEAGVPEGPGYCIPQSLIDQTTSGEGSNFEINYLDPDFEIPSEWKFNIGATWLANAPLEGFLGGDYVVNADFLMSYGENTAIWLRGDLEATGVTANGAPSYSSVREGSFVLTNADDDSNRSLTLSASVAKSYDNGIDWSLGYSHNKNRDVQPMTSSVAFSNYNNRAAWDPQASELSISDYNIAHRFVARFGFERDFWADNATRISLIGFANSGAPYSDTFDGETDYGFFNQFGALPNDGERNQENAGWWGKVDARFEQEFPGVMPGHKAAGYVIIDNLTNLISDEWGILETPDFPPLDNVSRDGDASLYSIRFGVRYDF